MDKLIEFFMKHLKASEEDAIIGSMFALGGLTLDLMFFPAGLGTGMVTAISAGAGLLLSRFYRKTPFYKNKVLKGIDKMVKAKRRGGLILEYHFFFRINTLLCLSISALFMSCGR